MGSSCFGIADHPFIHVVILCLRFLGTLSLECVVLAGTATSCWGKDNAARAVRAVQGQAATPGYPPLQVPTSLGTQPPRYLPP